MTNKLIISALGLALCASANAGSLTRSVQQSKASTKGSLTAVSGEEGSLAGSLGLLLDSGEAVVDVVALPLQGSAWVAEKAPGAIKDSAEALAKGVSFVVSNPGEASKMTGRASKAVLIASANGIEGVFNLIGDASTDFSTAPGASVVNSANASVGAIVDTMKFIFVDVSGAVVTASGKELKERFGDNASMVVTASGDLYQVTEGSIVFSANETGAVASAVYDSALKPIGQFSVAQAESMIEMISTAPKSSEKSSNNQSTTVNY